MSSSTEGPRPAPPTAIESPKASFGWLLFALSLSILLCQLDTNIVNVGLPTLAQVFQVSFGAVQWVVLSYLLAVTAVIVSVGRLGDRLGKKRLFLAGLTVFTIASIGCGAAQSLGFMIAARATQGVGAAILLALSFSFVGDNIPKARTGYAMGILSTVGSLGTTLGPSLGGAAIATFGFRSMFFLNVPLCVVAYLVARRHLPDTSERATARLQARFDWPGTIVLVATLTAYALAMTFSQARGFGDRVVVELLLAAAGSLTLFLVIQTRAPSPLLDLAMFREWHLSASLVMSVLVMTVMMATLALGPFFLSRALRLPTGEVGLVMSAGPLVAVLMAVPSGWVVDRIGARRTTVFGLVCFTLGAFSMSGVSLAHGALGYVVPVVVLSVGYAFFQTPNNAAVMTDARPDRRGVVSSLLTLARNLGLITGASLMGALFATAIGARGHTMVGVGDTSPEAVVNAMRVTFRVAGSMGLAALLLSVLSLSSAGRRPRAPSDDDKAPAAVRSVPEITRSAANN